MKQNPILQRALESEKVALAKAARQDGASPFFTVAESKSAPRTVFEGAELVNLGSNNYLGLAGNEEVIEATVEATRTHGTGLTGSRLLNGNSDAHIRLEEMLCRFTGAEAALVFSTGYGANLGAISGLCSVNDTAVVDAEVHASVYDGVTLSRTQVRQFRHNNIRHATKVLTGLASDRAASGESNSGTMLIVDGVYSMLGDVAPLTELAELCDRTGALLFSDEAHGLGVLGATGIGAVEQAGILDQTDVISYTFSKSLATCGGAVVASKAVIDALKVSARPFIFTAANTPGSLGTAIQSLKMLMENPQWPAEVMDRSQYLRNALESHGIPVNQSDSAIITVPIGDTMRTLAAWRALREAGVFVGSVLSPAVKPGKELLRLSVMRTHTDADLDDAAAAFASIERFITPEPSTSPSTNDLAELMAS